MKYLGQGLSMKSPRGRQHPGVRVKLEHPSLSQNFSPYELSLSHIWTGRCAEPLPANLMGMLVHTPLHLHCSFPGACAWKDNRISKQYECVSREYDMMPRRPRTGAHTVDTLLGSLCFQAHTPGNHHAQGSALVTQGALWHKTPKYYNWFHFYTFYSHPGALCTDVYIFSRNETALSQAHEHTVSVIDDHSNFIQ